MTGPRRQTATRREVYALARVAFWGWLSLFAGLVSELFDTDGALDLIVTAVGAVIALAATVATGLAAWTWRKP